MAQELSFPFSSVLFYFLINSVQAYRADIYKSCTVQQCTLCNSVHVHISTLQSVTNYYGRTENLLVFIYIYIQ